MLNIKIILNTYLLPCKGIFFILEKQKAIIKILSVYHFSPIYPYRITITESAPQLSLCFRDTKA